MKHTLYSSLFISTFLISIFLYAYFDKSQLHIASPQIDNNKYLTENNKTIIDKLNKIKDIKNQREILGIIKNGTFIEAETKLPLKLTNIGIVDELLPENGLLNLTKYEGKAIMVSNQLIDIEWIWGAKITEVGDLILAKVVKKVFNLQ